MFKILLALTVSVVLFASLPEGGMAGRGGVPGPGTLDFDPASDADGNHSPLPWGIDANVALGISEQILDPFYLEVGAGEFYVPANLWFTNSAYSDEARARLEAEGYTFAAETPMEDFLAKVARVTFVVDEGTRQQHRWTFTSPLNIVKVVTVGTIFEGAFPPALLPLPMAIFIGKLAPEPVGVHTVRVVVTMSDLHNDGLGFRSGNILEPGDNTLAFWRFEVVPRR